MRICTRVPAKTNKQTKKIVTVNCIFFPYFIVFGHMNTQLQVTHNIVQVTNQKLPTHNMNETRDLIGTTSTARNDELGTPKKSP